MDLDQLNERIGIPPRTPLIALLRVGENWHVWIAVRDPQQPYSKWEGTYICLDPAGGATRVTVYDDLHEEMMIIK